MNHKDTKNSTLTRSLKEGKLVLPDGYTIPDKPGHKTSFKSVRKNTYRGKTVQIETTYKVMIDGEPLSSHITVHDDGSVQCHDFPNYSFLSAMDMTKKIIDAAVEFNEPEDELTAYNNEHGGHH